MLHELAVDIEVIEYLKTPPDAETLRAIVAKLDDPHTDLVRRDAQFAKLELTDADVVTADQVIDLVVAHPALLQRPVLVAEHGAIIGRPTDRVPAFLTNR